MINSLSPPLFHCYLIQNASITKTYIGSTNNFPRRIRQHNGEICGGARYTAGDCWKPAILLSGFASWSQTLRFEYIWKHLKLRHILNKRNDGTSATMNRRLQILEYLLQKEEWAHLTVWTHAEIAALLTCDQPIRDIEELFNASS